MKNFEKKNAEATCVEHIIVRKKWWILLVYYPPHTGKDPSHLRQNFWYSEGVNRNSI